MMSGEGNEMRYGVFFSGKFLLLSLGLYVTCMRVWSISPTFDMLQHNNMSVSVAEFFRRKTKQHSFLWLVEKRLWTEKIIYVWSLDLLREKEWDFLQQQKKSSLRALFSVVIEGWKTLGYTSCSAAATLSYSLHTALLRKHVCEEWSVKENIW